MNSWKTYRLSFTGKAERILKTLTLREKISLMSGRESKKGVRGAIQSRVKNHYNEHPYRAGGLEKKGIPPMLFADGTRGVVCGTGRAVCFPVSAMRGASFNPRLEKKIGAAMAEEVLDAGGNLFGGVCVNLPYHPGWGRAQETYGEDPFLLGTMGSALVEGVQSRGVIACVKHFAFNSMENSRFKVSVRCGKRAEREVFLPQFHKCVEAGAGAVMSAYNAYQGVLCGHHDYLLNQVLKKEWGFDGFVMNDFLWGIKDTVDSVNGGMDMEMPATLYFGEKLEAAVRAGKVAEDRIDDACLRILRTLLAHQEAARALAGRPADYQAHRRLALQSAREGITLLKNRDHILPLRSGKEKRKILVLGELADRENTGDHGSSRVYSPPVTTLLGGILEGCGGAEVIYYRGECPSHCKRLAREADAVVIVAGNDYSDEGECVAMDEWDPSGHVSGGDRVRGLGLKERDLSVIRSVAEVRKDAIVALVGGSAITVSEWEKEVAAILFVYYPGMEGGRAFAEVLFGKVNPGGKLPFVIPEKEEDLPDMDWDTEEITYRYYHGYTLLNREKKRARYPFGFGLSYTSFRLRDMRAERRGRRITAEVLLENTGDRDGAEVVQMYVGAEGSAAERPDHVLKDFRKVFLKAGEEKRVRLSCSLREMAYYDEAAGRFVEEVIPYQVYLGTSSAREDLTRLDAVGK